MIGRLHPQKGHSVALQALVRIARKSPEVVLEILGDGSLRRALASEMETLGLTGKVRFVGPVRHDEVPRYIARWHVAIFPSLWEGFCIAAAEAMAMEIPVVASRVEGLLEVVEDGVSGILVPTKDAEALAGAVLELLSDPARAAAMGRQGRARVAARFDLAGAAARLLEVYRSALDGVQRG